MHEVYILKQGTYIHFCSSAGTAVSQLRFRTYLDVIVSGNTPGKICRKSMLISQPKVSVSLLECVLISDDKYFLLFNLPKLKKNIIFCFLNQKHVFSPKLKDVRNSLIVNRVSSNRYGNIDFNH